MREFGIILSEQQGLGLHQSQLCKPSKSKQRVTVLTVMHLNALLKPLHPNIGTDILLVVLSTFPKVLIRRIVKQSRASLVGDHYSNSCHLNV